jgi:hypothetical protein
VLQEEPPNPTLDFIDVRGMHEVSFLTVLGKK